MKETHYQYPGCPVSIALVCDTHNTAPAPILRSLEKHRPAIITIAGDILAGQPMSDGLIVQEEKNALPLLRGCADIAPTYLSVGNHEWMICDEDKDLIRSTGTMLLDNFWKDVTIQNQRLIIGGLSSDGYCIFQEYRKTYDGRYPEYEGIPEGGKPDTSWLDAYCAEDGYHILLSHHPEYYEPYLKNRHIEMILSGHAHGGQWRFFGRGVYAPGQGYWPKYTSGIYGNMIVSKGLANTTRISRINNPTEIVYLTGKEITN